MSRMLAFTALEPTTWTEAVGARTLAAFGELARLHADGWGTAWTTEAARGRLEERHSVTPFSPASAREISSVSAIRSGLLYLRFASGDSAVTPENVQPFVRAGIAFQHNGALVPREHLLASLTAPERASLSSTTDSELYFVLAVRHGLQADPLEAMTRTATELRSAYPAACLNAIVLHPLGLIVVHSAGPAAAPLAAFERRGFRPPELPAGHDHTYNRLSLTRAASGTTLVATTGFDQTGWVALPPDSVTLLSGADTRTVML